MLRKCTVAVLIVGVLFVIGCAAQTHIHKIGNGAQGNDMMEARQWYVLFGLVPINQVSTKAMVGGATDYEIMTGYTTRDFIRNIITGFVSINSRTVTVRK